MCYQIHVYERERERERGKERGRERGREVCFTVYTIIIVSLWSAMSQYWLCLTSWGCVVLIPRARSAPHNSHASHSMENLVLFNVSEGKFIII